MGNGPRTLTFKMSPQISPEGIIIGVKKYRFPFPGIDVFHALRQFWINVKEFIYFIREFCRMCCLEGNA